MSNVGKEPVPPATRRFRASTWVIRGLVVAFIVYAFKVNYERDQDLANPIYVPIVAEPYEWPEGCEEKEYNDGDAISSACQSDEYYMGSGLKYRYRNRPDSWWRRNTFATGSRNSAIYYRVGNDALDTICPVIDKGYCKIVNIEKDVFKVDPNE